MVSCIAVQQRHRIFREGLSQLLAAEEDIEIVGLAATGDDLVAICESRCLDVVVIEADATEWDAMRLAASVRRLRPQARIIGLTSREATLAESTRARRGGLVALVARTGGIEGILSAVRTARHQPSPARPTPATRPVPAAPTTAPLTERELAILNLVAAGLTSREISGRLVISHKTVESHKQRIFGKLGVQNQAHAVSVAMRTGLMRPERVISLAAAESR